MYTTHFVLSSYIRSPNREGGEGPRSFDEAVESSKADQKKKMEALLIGMTRSRDAQAQGARQQQIDQFGANDELNRELSIALVGAPPTKRVPDIGRTEAQESAQALLRRKPEGGEKTLAGFPGAKFTTSENGVDIFTQGDRTILSTPGKDPTDFSTEIFNSKKALIMSQYGAKMEVPKEVRVARVRPIHSPGPVRSNDSAPTNIAEATKSNQALLEEAKKRKADMLVALAQPGVTNRSPYEEEIRKADIEIARLERSISEGQERETYAQLSPEARELADMKRGMGAMRKEFDGLLAQEARGVRIDKKKRDSLMADLIRANDVMKKLDRSQAELTRVEGEVRSARATIDARRGNDTYGTLGATIRTAESRIATLKANIEIAKGPVKQILAQYSESSGEKRV